MENIEHNPTLAEAANAFLSNLPPQERSKTQAEISKFVRWLGSSRQVQDVNPVDVASYGEQIIPSAVKPLKSFLTYIWQKGFSKINLAPHLRARKTSSKTAILQQSSQVRPTLTAQGYARLKAELTSLKNQRSQVIEEIQRAAADKDFRENAPLAAAREQKSYLEGRIKELEATLNLARIVEEDRDTSRAKVGDTVVLRDLSSGKEFIYTLVDPREANPARGKLSVASPLGRVILDKEKGQTVEVDAPAGTFRCHIDNITRANEQEQLQANRR
ncbi:MAG TPA: transcription elongation factor GreA [Chloroflexi bacterium]|nr:transcription elongation factor GreA [Chloroflexota bacterium]